MSIIDTLITDRSAADLSTLRSLLAAPFSQWTAEQKEQFNLAAMKGAYNYTDLNRVNAAMDDLKAKLESYGYAVPGYQKVEIQHNEEGGGSSGLPDGYTLLEYIQSSGTQYIDTGFKPNQDTGIVMDVALTNTSADNTFFGARTSATSKVFMLMWENEGYHRWYYNNNYSNLTSAPTNPTTRRTISVEKGEVTIGGVSFAGNYGAFNCDYNMTLLAMNALGSVSVFASAKLYSCQIYDNGSLVRDYVPCINPNGEIGLFDKVGKQFYGNSGTETFIAGNVVPSEVRYESRSGDTVVRDPYLWYEDDAPTVSDMEAYLSNVSAIRNVLSLLPTSPMVPDDMDGLTVDDANAIEQILVDVETVILRVVSGFARSASFMFVSGNRPIPTAESDLGRTWEELDKMQTTWENWQVATWYLLLYGNLKAEGVVE